MGKIVIYSEEINLFIKELLVILFEKKYFGFPDSAKAYKDKLISYIEKYVGIIPGKNAPKYFDRYGNNLKYISYKANKTTTWYIFYQQRENVFLIRYITNNHAAAQYFGYVNV